MLDRTDSCAFTGHRPNKLRWGGDESDPVCLSFKALLSDTVRAVYDAGVRHFICGMASGCDLMFCEAVMALREERPGVTLEAAIPWKGQADHWDSGLRRRYFRLVSECDYQTVVRSEYAPDCMQRRNAYMVDSASVLIAAYNGSPGGTRNTLLYALRQGLRIIELEI